MTHSTPDEQSPTQDRVESIRRADFPAGKYGRGYDRRAVRAFVDRTAALVGALEQQLQDAETEVARLQKRVIEGPRGDEVIQAVSVISSAQRTADSVIADANSYSSRVMSEAHAAYDDARRRAAQVEHDAEENVRRLALTSKVHQEELDKQTAYLRTLHDATMTQMQKFLEGMLSHLAEEYGRAHPIAASAAAEVGRSENGARVRPEVEVQGATSPPEAEETPAESPNGLVSVATHSADDEVGAV